MEDNNPIPILNPLKSAVEKGHVTTPDQIKDLEKYLCDRTGIIKITYSELNQLRDNSQLIPGKRYRITDYVSTCNSSGSIQEQITTSSAGHPFDIIVTARTNNLLHRSAEAAHHEGDTYFASSNLSAWTIEYDIRNDVSIYKWADETNGKGVIYYMKDEFENECPYDFKNILYNGEYTFSDIGSDASLNINKTTVFNNVIRPLRSNNLNILNNIILSYARVGVSGLNVTNGRHDNVFEADCASITTGNNCSFNTFGEGCSGTLAYNCSYNTFGTSCNFVLESGCSFNKIGDNCRTIMLGQDSSFNTVKSRCVNNRFNGNNNTFGYNCSFNNFTTCIIQGCVLEDNCAFNKFDINSESTPTYYNLHFLQNVIGTSQQYNLIKIESTSITDKTIISKDEHGNIIISNNPNPYNKGFVSGGTICKDIQLKRINKAPGTKIYYTLKPGTYNSLSEFEGLRTYARTNKTWGELIWYEYDELSEDNTVEYSGDYTLGDAGTYDLVYNKGWYLCQTDYDYGQIVGTNGKSFYRKDNTDSGLVMLANNYEYAPFDNLISSRTYVKGDTFETPLGDSHYGKISLGVGHNSKSIPDIKTGFNIICHKDGSLQRGVCSEIRNMSNEYTSSGEYLGTRVILGQNLIEIQKIIDYSNIDKESEAQYEECILTGIADPENETDAVNKRYVDSLKQRVIVNYGSDFILSPNTRMRIPYAISKDINFILKDSFQIVSEVVQIFGDDRVQKFEVEFAVDPEVETIPQINFRSGNYDPTIYWEKPLEIKAGCFYRITIDYNIATYIEIPNYTIVRPR